MLLLLHALIPSLAAYILPSCPVLLHVYCPHPTVLQHILSSSPVLLHIYCTSFSIFGTIIPTSGQKKNNLCRNEDQYLSQF